MDHSKGYSYTPVHFFRWDKLKPWKRKPYRKQPFYFQPQQSGLNPQDWNNCWRLFLPFLVRHCFTISADTLYSPRQFGVNSLRIRPSIATWEIRSWPGLGLSPPPPSVALGTVATGLVAKGVEGKAVWGGRTLEGKSNVWANKSLSEEVWNYWTFTKQFQLSLDTLMLNQQQTYSPIHKWNNYKFLFGAKQQDDRRNHWGH